jgi:hypothetical protein
MFMVFLMTAIGMVYTESIMEEALSEASLHVRAEVPLLLPSQEGFVQDLVFQALVKKAFEKALEKRRGQRLIFTAQDPLEDVDVSCSSFYDEETGLMRLVVEAQWPLIFFEEHPMTIKRVLYCRPFSQFRQPLKFLEKEGIRTVYMADHPSVYHTNPNCRSIKNRNKTAVDLSEIQGHYRECKFCQRERCK